MQGKLKDGRIMMINMGDGINARFDSKDKSSNDFIMVEGKVYRLDVTHMDYNKEDLGGKRKLYTAKGERAFKKNECVLEFGGED